MDGERLRDRREEGERRSRTPSTRQVTGDFIGFYSGMALQMFSNWEGTDTNEANVMLATVLEQDCRRLAVLDVNQSPRMRPRGCCGWRRAGMSRAWSSNCLSAGAGRDHF